MDTSDQPNSICHVQTIQMYPIPACDPPITLPFKLLAGEGPSYHGKTVDGLIVLTNYRLYLQAGSNHNHLPIGLIEGVEHRELFYLHIACKDARTYRCIFSNNEACLEWFELISKATEPKQLEQMFAFFHFIWSKRSGGEEVQERISNSRYYFDHTSFRDEMDRLGFKGDSWRISEANKNYKLCPTYPPYLIVPSCINDETLEAVATFRSSRRIPAVVWRHATNGAVIARCSQPEVGWLGWRSSKDEDLIKAISQACSFDQRNDKDTILSHSPGSFHSEDSLQITDIGANKEKKVLIMDARSYTTAVANRARGGGCECPEYYPNCEIQFMNLANIHSIRKSFNALRVLCSTSADQPNWFSQLEGTRWFQHMSGLMKAAVTLVNAVQREARPVLVHCSDGWDRTPQIVALAELLLDPFYRTVEGFRILIEREWLAFGHKFADRCGHSSTDDANERCPVFLQWLDCVHQLLLQYECAFEFSQGYLVKLAQHVYANLYGTFLCNTFRERLLSVDKRTFSVWEFLGTSRFKNHLYTPPGTTCGNKVLWPQCNVRDLQFWQEVYLGSWEANFGPDGACPGPPDSSSPSYMTKTRSYGDLLNATEVSPNHFRRSSDPSIAIDTKLVKSQDANGHQELSNGHQAELTNGHQGQQLSNGHFLSNGHSDECNGTTDAISDENGALIKEVSVQNGFLANHHVINGDKTESESEESVSACDNNDNDNNHPSCACSCGEDVTSYCNNGEATTFGNDGDSDNEATEKSESRSENTVCDAGATERLETSTDTLVSDSHNISSSPLEVNGFEKIQTPAADGVDSIDAAPHLSAQNLRLVNGAAASTSPIPMFSRASSGSGWDTGLSQFKQSPQSHPYNLGDDGLVPVVSVAQERLFQIMQEHRRREELLEKELHTHRQALLRQLCHKCHSDGDKLDDNGSVADSVGSAGEGQASAVESLRSDMSWEALEDNMTDCTATLWVPDHAVSRCTGCQTEFWVGKRKHHCRKCGRIFCASCSENSTPLPSEQLYNPVRVCTGCYSKLRRDCGELPDQCKHSSGHQPTNANPQIAASSN